MQADKTRTKMIAELESVLKDESAHVARYKRTSSLIKALGIGSLLVAWWIAGTPWNWTIAAAALFAAVGGLLGGLSVAYDNSLRSWPIIRTLLKDNALEILKDERRTGLGPPGGNAPGAEDDHSQGAGAKQDKG